MLHEYNNIKNLTAEKNMPHILCQYAYNLTKIFNSFYNSIHILNEEDN
jgi:arginyl-tRNA synthetase